MLSGELYETLNLTREEALVHLLPESRVYAAHFPGHPVTPGVALVQTALELLSELEGKPLEIKASKSIKFLIPVLPGAELRFRFAGEGEIREVAVETDGDLCARMTLAVE